MGFFSSGESKQTSTQTMPQWQENAVRQNLSDAMSQGPIKFTDRNLTAGPDAAMYAGLNGLNGMANNGLSGRYLGNAARNGLGTLMDPTAYQPQFDQGAFDSVMGNTNLSRDMAALDAGYNTKLADGLKRAGYGAGGFSGNFGSTGMLAKSGAVGAAAGDYTQALAGLYGGTRDRALQAGMQYGSQGSANRLNAANSLVNNAYAGIGMNAGLAGQQFNMGNVFTGLNQAGIDREVGRDMYNAESPMKNILFRQGLAGRMGDYGGTTTVTSPTASPFQQALGAGIGLAGAYMTGGGSLMGGGLGSLFGGGGAGNSIAVNGSSMGLGNFSAPY